MTVGQNTLMSVPKESGYSLLDIFCNGCLLQVLISHFNQCFSWPTQEPYNSRIVHQPWVHTRVVPQVVSCFAHAQHHVEVVLHSAREELLQFVIWGFHLGVEHFVLFFAFDLLVLQVELLDSVPDAHIVILSEQVGYFSYSEDVVDIL